mmetsp:Transcript_22920/g.50268  ORF Transcript_22920/g.50268 Transcript_22920/m.50268 type:complete len:226 (-) Transcript_22920:720-1397(-)
MPRTHRPPDAARDRALFGGRIMLQVALHHHHHVHALRSSGAHRFTCRLSITRALCRVDPVPMWSGMHSSLYLRSHTISTENAEFHCFHIIQAARWAAAAPCYCLPLQLSQSARPKQTVCCLAPLRAGCHLMPLGRQRPFPEPFEQRRPERRACLAPRCRSCCWRCPPASQSSSAPVPCAAAGPSARSCTGSLARCCCCCRWSQLLTAYGTRAVLLIKEDMAGCRL